NIVPLDFPPLTFETEGLWFEIPRPVQDETERRLFHFMGGIHAAEHAAIAVLPLLVLTDRNDLGGISTPLHPQLARAAVFIYDAMPGGVGLTRQAFSRMEELFTRTLAAIAGCGCENGCPSCVHSPKCGSGNRPIDKVASQFILQAIIDGVTEEGDGAVVELVASPPEPARPEAGEKVAPARFAVMDLETQLSAQEVGGWGRADRMKMSLGVVYDSVLNESLAFREDQAAALVQALRAADLVVGFNIKRFDYAVLGAYGDFGLTDLPTLDMLERIHARLGVRVSLDTLAQATLGAAKSADGLKALTWWKQGRLAEIEAYCRKDVEITRDLYLFGRDNGYLLYTNKAGKVVRCPVDW
ncbi:MAG: Zn-binding domain-containing protein, partial [Halothiobacillaceae bacterium]